MSGIIQQATLRGVIQSEGKLSGAVQPEAVLKGSVAIPSISQGESYTGPYEVTPDIDGETLVTSLKTMLGNVVVNPIPYAEVSNNTGGLTVTIGGK